MRVGLGWAGSFDCSELVVTLSIPYTIKPSRIVPSKHVQLHSLHQLSTFAPIPAPMHVINIKMRTILQRISDVLSNLNLCSDASTTKTNEPAVITI